jgi:hypothetical protein
LNRLGIYLLLLFSSAFLYAQNTQINWEFSGMVTNESGEHYQYFFELKRQDKEFRASAIVLDGDNKAVLLQENSSAVLEQSEATRWTVGNLFLRFNPITNNWIFGVKNKDGTGFNFKVDMFGLSDEAISKKQDIHSGLELLVSQTGRLNGHLQTGSDKKEQFVTAQRAWLKQVWLSQPLSLKQPLRGVLCQFKDGNAFYAMHLEDSHALRASVAGWRNALGASLSMSQFVGVKEEEKNEGSWMIQIASPKVKLSLKNMLLQADKEQKLVMGMTKEMPGFCTISQLEIGATLG